jgi:hypothetical protein
MGIKNDRDTFFDVCETPLIGRLDETVHADMMSDAALIRRYIRIEKEAADASAPGRKLPSIARTVLTSVWESPRIGFHRSALDSTDFNLKDFGRKLLLIPWSVEAFERWNSTHSAAGLVLEHVTPIDWMWQKLKELDIDPDEPCGLTKEEDWQLHAASFLVRHYMLAVLTREQASKIDAEGLKKTGVEHNPFLRYRQAEYKMDAKRAQGSEIPAFSTKRFIVPGPQPTA